MLVLKSQAVDKESLYNKLQPILGSYFHFINNQATKRNSNALRSSRFGFGIWLQLVVKYNYISNPNPRWR